MDEPRPPAWVSKRDGRQVPFEADKISRALFAAGEALGEPDPFRARELADGVVHFLAAESDGPAPTTEQIEEVVIKVVRELGQPALAGAFAAHARRRRRGPRATAPAGGEVVLRFGPGSPLPALLDECARAYTLQAVFARDLAAAHAAGLLVLTGLKTPGELEGCVLGPPAQVGDDLTGAVERLRRFVGEFVAVDGPEHVLAAGGGDARALAEALALGLRLSGLRAVVNLNAAAAPSWAGELAPGPLFAAPKRPDPGDLAERADALFEELLGVGRGAVRVDWHLGERDFRPEAGGRLLRVARAAVEGAAVGFVFDRPRRPPALAEGVDRQHPAVLLTVGLDLAALARQPATGGDADTFLRRLGSLARLALSAAVQKRAFLRAQPGGDPAVTSGFLLDRARLVVAPLGLDEAVRVFRERGLGAGGAAREFGRQVVLRLREVLREDGRAAQMGACLDGPFSAQLADRGPAGLTPWDAAAPVKGQLRAGGVLHGLAEHGTLTLFAPAAPEQLAEWLGYAWRHTDVVRLRLAHESRAG